MNTKIYVSWEGFCWVWNFEKEVWLIDLEKSGGPPSPYEKTPLNPPFKVTKDS